MVQELSSHVFDEILFDVLGAKAYSDEESSSQFNVVDLQYDISLQEKKVVDNPSSTGPSRDHGSKGINFGLIFMVFLGILIVVVIGFLKFSEAKEDKIAATEMRESMLYSHSSSNVYRESGLWSKEIL